MTQSMHHDYPTVKTKTPLPDARPKALRLAFHAASVAIMLKGFTALNNVAMGDYVAPQYGGFFQFLTINGLLVAGLAMAFGGLGDVLPNVKSLRSIKRFFLLSALPVEITISAIYWPIIIFAPSLMLPSTEPSAESDGLFRIPLWMDLSMHAVPAIALVIDFFAIEPKFLPPVSNQYAPVLALSWGAIYSTWVEHCASINGRFPYPFLTMSDLPGRIAIYIGASVFAYGVFRVLNWIHR
ncbi:hypothetical protein P7C73_g2395, partial [Tremellales sp. Uapishka_1]